MVGCVTPSEAVSEVSRQGPDRSRAAAVAAAASDISRRVCERISQATRPSPAATSVASARSRAPSEISASNRSASGLLVVTVRLVSGGRGGGGSVLAHDELAVAEGRGAGDDDGQRRGLAR
jgi:hypothetical protein